jgi:hypothetical protein
MKAALPFTPSRRLFLARGLGLAALSVVPAHVLGRGGEPPGNRLNLVFVGVGDRGRALHGSHGAGGWQLLPKARDDAYPRPAPRIPRVNGHHADWVSACKGGPGAGANWNYGGPLAEVALLGVLAQRFNGQRLEWDARNLRVTNFPAANAFIHPPYREGWAT